MKLMRVRELRDAMQERDLAVLNQHIYTALIETTLYFQAAINTKLDRVTDNLDYFYLGDGNPTRDNDHVKLVLNNGFVLKGSVTYPVVIKRATTMAGLATAEPTTQLLSIDYALGTVTLLESPLAYPYVSVGYASGFETDEDVDGDAPNEIYYGSVYTGLPAWLTNFARLQGMDTFRNIKDWAGDAKQGAMERTRKSSVISPPDKTFHMMLLEPYTRIFPTGVWPINR